MRPLLILLSLGSLVFWALGATPGLAQAQYEVGPQSQLHIDGTATTGAFTCSSDTVRGVGTFTSEKHAAAVAVPVATLDCGRAPMNRDLRDALRADQHPTIRFELEDARVVAETAGGYTIRAGGRLEIAGTTRPIAVTLDGERLPDGALRATGQVPLRMTSFGIDPPTALLGLVKTQDDILVRFDLLATPQVLLSAD